MKWTNKTLLPQTSRSIKEVNIQPLYKGELLTWVGMNIVMSLNLDFTLRDFKNENQG